MANFNNKYKNHNYVCTNLILSNNVLEDTALELGLVLELDLDSYLSINDGQSCKIR